MFKKLLNVGKGHSSNDRLQQQQKNLFQLNEIRSYGFSQLTCIGYSSTLSLLAVGSKHGLLRVLGNPSVEFSHQLGSGNSITRVEFVDHKETSSPKSNTKKKNQQNSSVAPQTSPLTPSKLIALTDNGQLYLFELKTVKQPNFADNSTQTDGSNVPATNCCQNQSNENSQQSSSIGLEFTKLELVGQLDYFRFKLDDEDRSKRVTTFEVSADASSIYVGTEGSNVYIIGLDKFEPVTSGNQQQVQENNIMQTGTKIMLSHDADDSLSPSSDSKPQGTSNIDNDDQRENTAVNLNDDPQIEEVEEPFDMIKFDEHIAPQLLDDIKNKKQGAIESIKKHPSSNGKLLISYHRGLNVIIELKSKQVEKQFYHNQKLESSCFSGQSGEFFYTSHNDGSYVKWDIRKGSQTKANEDFLSQLYGPYPCKPTPKIQACTGLVNDQLEDLVIFSGGMPRATYDDKNPVTIVKTQPDGRDNIKVVLDFTSKVLDFVVITRPRGGLGAGAKSTGGGGGGGKKGKHKQQQQQQRNIQIAVALAILAEEEFVVIDLLNSESYLEFALPYLNCVHSSAITCNQHYSDISDELYEQLMSHNKQQLKDKLSPNEWPITGGKVIDAPEIKSHDILLTGHEDGSVDFWDVSDLSMRHLLHLTTARFFSTNEEDLVPINSIDSKGADNEDQANVNSSVTNNNEQENGSAWPPMKKVGRFDPYSDDTRFAVRKISLCPQTGTLVVAGTGGQVLVFELKDKPKELESLDADEVTLVSDHRFVWKGCEKLTPRTQLLSKPESGYQVVSYVQLSPPVAATSLDLRADWHLFAIGTSYGFVLYDYVNKHPVVNRCTLNVQDFAIVSGDAAAGAISRKKSFRKSLRESFRRLRRGRSQRQQPAQPITGVVEAGSKQAPAFGRLTTGVRALNAPSMSATGDSSPSSMAVHHRNIYSAERQVEQKIELSSIVKCITLTAAIISNNASFKPSLWVGTNSGQVLVYAIDLASEQQKTQRIQDSVAADSAEIQTQNSEMVNADGEQVVRTTAKLSKEIQLKHRAPIIAIFTSPQAPSSQRDQIQGDQTLDSANSTPLKQASGLLTSAAESAAKSTNDQTGVDSGKPTADTNLSEGERAPSPSVQAVADVFGEKSPKKSDKDSGPQARVLICSEEQFKVFNLPNLKPFCKFKLTAHEGLRAKKISITQFIKPASKMNQSNSLPNSQVTNSVGALAPSKSLQSFATQTSPPSSPVPPASNEDIANETSNKQAANGANSKKSESNNNSLSALNNNNNHTKSDSKELMNAKFGSTKSPTTATLNAISQSHTDSQQTSESGCLFEPYMVCMSNQGDCAIYSVPDLKRQAQIQVCKREDINGITSTMLTNFGEGFYLRSSSNFLRFSISSQRVLRVLSVI